MLLSSESWTKVFILCNCSFVVFGVVLLALGIQPQITLNQFRTILQNAKPEIFLVVSISGGLGVLGSFVGIYGHSKKQKVIIYMGCVSAIIEYTQTYLNIIMYLCFTFGIIQAVYLILSFLRIRKFEGDDFLSA
ncbi:unnamed protein product [Schistosoma guineensis]|nr:unnamed protein product [Schistosoma guineensis]